MTIEGILSIKNLPSGASRSNDRGERSVFIFYMTERSDFNKSSIFNCHYSIGAKRQYV